MLEAFSRCATTPSARAASNSIPTSPCRHPHPAPRSVRPDSPAGEDFVPSSKNAALAPTGTHVSITRNLYAESISVDDVPLFASNEPITLRQPRSTCASAPHPSPAKAEKGKTKSRLEPDGERAETVAQVALWRYHEGLDYNTIADRLNADPGRYPPPTAPSKSRTRGARSKSSVAGVLKNPKYTGYQVFNRRATTSKRGKVNEPFKWVWSPKPVHEPLIAKWMFDELTSRLEARRGSRADAQPNANPKAERTYLFHGLP
ncbi:recombinase family protein [Amycolatopsis japonica]|uniref:recombinase family protein n=1 Tax=Amycolatopsis japonica TaxID=208439 RepID=UPI003808B659